MTFLTRRQLLSVPPAFTSHDLLAQSYGGLPPIAMPKAHFASVAILWDKYYKKSINDVLNNLWTSGKNSWRGLKEGALCLVSLANGIPLDLRNKVIEVKSAIKPGIFNIRSGPITGSNRNLILRSDQVADDRFLAAMNIYVRGVEGKVPGAK